MRACVRVCVCVCVCGFPWFELPVVIVVFFFSDYNVSAWVLNVISMQRTGSIFMLDVRALQIFCYYRIINTFSGARVLVAGGTGTIGSGIVMAMLKQGARVPNSRFNCRVTCRSA